VVDLLDSDRHRCQYIGTIILLIRVIIIIVILLPFIKCLSVTMSETLQKH